MEKKITHYELEIEKLEERIAPGLLGGLGGCDCDDSASGGASKGSASSASKGSASSASKGSMGSASNGSASCSSSASADAKK